MIIFITILAVLFVLFAIYPLAYIAILEETKHGDITDKYWRLRYNKTITTWMLYKHAFGFHTFWCDVKDDAANRRWVWDGGFICFICGKTITRREYARRVHCLW
jgi:hypothetical protein